MLDLQTIERDRAERRAYWRARGVYADYTYADAIRDAMTVGADQQLVFHSRVRPQAATAGQVDADAERIAAAFYSLGLRCGDYIAVMLPTWKECFLAYLAAFKLGLALVPIVPIYGAREIGFIMRQTKARALVIPETYRGFDYIARVEQAGDLPDLQHLIVVGDKAPAGAIRWRDLPSDPGEAYPKPRGIADEVCLVIYTSGTTSDPKGVKHTHNTMLCDLNAARAAGVQPYPAPELGKPSLSVFPAGHIAGFLAMMMPFVSPKGDTIFVDQWLPEEAIGLIHKHRVVGTNGTPVFLTTLIEASEKSGLDISSLKSFSLGGSAVGPENVKMADALGYTSWRIYGMSEHTVVSNSDPTDPPERRAYTDGRITARNQVRIVDEEENDVAPGETGEVCTLGPRLFVGYVDQELDRASFLPGGWYKSGDIGRLDADGYLTITDRKKDIIIRGGENISAKEIEDLLGAMPGVIESAAVAMPDPVLTEKVCVYVLAAPEANVNLESVTAYFRGLGITRQKIPERVIVLADDFPRTPSGKIKKAELRAELRAQAAAPAE